jgi:hypothetical protein
VMYIGIICDDVFRTKIVINSVFIFTKVLYTAVILPNFCYPNKNIFVDYFWQKFLLVLLQNHVCHQLPAPGLPEDRGRAECLPSQNHGPQCPR